MLCIVQGCWMSYYGNLWICKCFKEIGELLGKLLQTLYIVRCCYELCKIVGYLLWKYMGLQVFLRQLVNF
jgi:hypothetical protein